MSFKGFGKHENGKVHPIYDKKGINESSFHIGDEIYPSRIPVGQQNKYRFALQKLIALDATPRKLHDDFDIEFKNKVK